MHGQLAEAQPQISELEEQLHASIMQDELRPLEIALAKAQKAVATTEIKIGRLRDELRESSDRETGIRVQARKAVKDAHEKLQDKVRVHKRTMEALTKYINTEAHAEQKILELREEAKKQQQWFEDQLASRAELAKQAEQLLKEQIAGMEERDVKEVQL